MLAILPLPGAKVLGLSKVVFGIAVTPAKLKHAAAKQREASFFNNLASVSPVPWFLKCVDVQPEGTTFGSSGD